jgi:nucleotide-binding universal stress UspA family protein
MRVRRKTDHDAPSALALPWARSGILVGVDGSEPAEAALKYATKLAEKLDLPLHVLVVWRDPALTWGDAYPYPASFAALEESANMVAARSVAEVFPDGPPVWLTMSARQGLPAPELITASREATMLVVGTRGHGGFTGLLLGSVSSACVSHAHCPVLVVREP